MIKKYLTIIVFIFGAIACMATTCNDPVQIFCGSGWNMKTTAPWLDSQLTPDDYFEVSSSPSEERGYQDIANVAGIIPDNTDYFVFMMDPDKCLWMGTNYNTIQSNINFYLNGLYNNLDRNGYLDKTIIVHPIPWAGFNGYSFGQYRTYTFWGGICHQNVINYHNTRADDVFCIVDTSGMGDENGILDPGYTSDGARLNYIGNRKLAFLIRETCYPNGN